MPTWIFSNLLLLAPSQISISPDDAYAFSGHAKFSQQTQLISPHERENAWEKFNGNWTRNPLCAGPCERSWRRAARKKPECLAAKSGVLRFSRVRTRRRPLHSVSGSPVGNCDSCTVAARSAPALRGEEEETTSYWASGKKESQRRKKSSRKESGAAVPSLGLRETGTRLFM